MRETDDEVPEDSDFHPSNKLETDPVEVGKTTIQCNVKIFSKDTRTFSRRTYHLVFHRKDGLNLNFDLVPSSERVKRPIYELSTEESAEVKKQVDDLLMKVFIRPSTSSWGSSIIFVTKKDEGLRLWIDYRALNKATV
jgi:hypothetical protein